MGGNAMKDFKLGKIPLASWLLILAAVVSLMVGGVAAYLSASTGALKNDFAADTPTGPAVTEVFEGNEKTDVAVDVGKPGYAVYVRAAVVVTWKNGTNGDVLAAAPVAGADYTMALGSGWFPGSDGFYYYTEPVDASASLTDALIESCKPVEGRAPDGYGLNVEIIAQTIQALGTTDDGNKPAVTDAWGIEVVNGKLAQPAA